MGTPERRAGRTTATLCKYLKSKSDMPYLEGASPDLSPLTAHASQGISQEATKSNINPAIKGNVYPLDNVTHQQANTIYNLMYHPFQY